jgi:hypothetical protein
MTADVVQRVGRTAAFNVSLSSVEAELQPRYQFGHERAFTRAEQSNRNVGVTAQ